MNKKTNPRKISAGRSQKEVEEYQRFLKSKKDLNETEEKISTLASDASTIKEKKKKRRPKKKKIRPKKLKQKIILHFKKNWIGYFIGTLITIILSLAGWLFLNAYNFNAELGIVETKIENIEKTIDDYKKSGIISKNEYTDISNELEKIKNTYSKLEQVNKLEKDLAVFQISIEKDLEYLKNR